jgi:hypothetical protein
MSTNNEREQRASNSTATARTPVPSLDVADLAGVVYSSGKVFDGLRTSLLDTENFLRSGSLDGITSRADLALLQDLRDVAQYVLDNRDAPISNTYVREVNAQITRSGPLHPGHYRTVAQQIGVNTPYGRHEPAPVKDGDLMLFIDKAMARDDPREQALELFVQLAKAQPFEDGNKRTALFVANSVLIRTSAPEVLSIPVDENSTDNTDSTSSAARFNDLLARAYVFGEHDGIKDLLRADGFSRPFAAQTQKNASPQTRRHPELDGVQGASCAAGRFPELATGENGSQQDESGPALG